MAKKKSRKYADIREWIADQPARRQAKLARSLAELHEWYEHEEDGVLRWYEIGVRISDFFPDEGKRTYRGNLIELLADALDPDRTLGRAAFRNQLWEFRKIADHVKPAQAEAWAKKCNKKGQPLTLFHVSALLSIEGTAERNAILKQCLTESWSVRKVRSEVQNLSGGKRSRGRRKPKPKDVPRPVVALQEIQLNAERWLDNHEVWFAGKKAALAKVRKKDLTDELLVDMEAAEEGLMEMKKAVSDGLVAVRTLKKMTKESIREKSRG